MTLMALLFDLFNRHNGRKLATVLRSESSQIIFRISTCAIIVLITGNRGGYENILEYLETQSFEEQLAEIVRPNERTSLDIRCECDDG